MANIRKMRVEDIDKVVYLEETFLGETLGKEMFYNELVNKTEGVEFYVIEEEKIIGYISRYYFLEEMEILNFVIDLAYQRKGYGTKLFDYIVNEAKSVKKITLEVRASNEKGINFYQKYGFKKIGIRKNYYKNNEDAILLIKEDI